MSTISTKTMIGRRGALTLLGYGLALVVTSPALAQIQSQKPIIHGTPVTSPPVASPGFPPGALQIMADGSYVDTIDGQHSSQEFRLGSSHTISGKGLSGAVSAWLMSRRTRGDQAADVGSVLNIVAQSDTELQVEVTGTSAGQSVWEPGTTEGGLYIILRTNGGGRQFKFYVPQARYICAEGEANCAP